MPLTLFEKYYFLIQIQEQICHWQSVKWQHGTIYEINISFSSTKYQFRSFHAFKKKLEAEAHFPNNPSKKFCRNL